MIKLSQKRIIRGVVIEKDVKNMSTQKLKVYRALLIPQYLERKDLKGEEYDAITTAYVGAVAEIKRRERVPCGGSGVRSV